MKIHFSEEFEKELSKLSDKSTRIKMFKVLKKLKDNPDIGKPLRYDFRNHRSLRVHPFRIIYRIDGDCILVKYLDHRKSVYK